MSKIEDIVMIKEHSPHEIHFEVDPEDDHFCNVIILRKRDNTMATSHYILTSDVKQWREMYERDKWEIKEGKRDE